MKAQLHVACCVRRLPRLSLYNDDNKTVVKISYTFFCGTHRYEAGFTLQPDLPQQMTYMHGLDRRLCEKQRVSENVQYILDINETRHT